MSKNYRMKKKQQTSYSEEKGDEKSLFYACQSALEHKNNQQLINSVCNNHITTNKINFCHLDNNIKSRVKFGNGDLIEVNGLGAIEVQIKKKKKVMREVLQVPQADRNLLSVGQFMKHEYTLHFEDDYCTIDNKGVSIRVLRRVKMVNKCFPLNQKHINSMAVNIK